MRRLFFDLETDGLDPDVIHCIAVGEVGHPVWSYGPDQIKEGLEMLCEADELVAHNGLGYDFKVIEKLYPTWPFEGKRTDTLVLSRLIRADLKNEDFEYNWANSVMPKKLYGSQTWEDEALELAHETAELAENIGKSGWTFDEAKAGKLYAELCTRREELDHELQDLFEPWEVHETFIPKRNNSRLGYIEGEPFIKTTVVTFNHNSRRHIEYCLTKKYGWKPAKTTPQGHAIIDEVVLGSLDYPEAKKLAKLFLIQKRIGQLAEGPQAWMKKVDSDGKLRHRIMSPATRTLRCTHIQPNLSQVPATRLPYGKECRELFTVPAGGIEIRLFAHYLSLYDEGSYAKVVLESDIHTYNQKATGLASRDLAKVWLYSTLYGAGDTKVGSIVGKGAKEGKKLKDNFIKAVPAYGTLKTNVEKAAAKGFIKTLGKNQIKVNSSHTALNSLLQSAGAVICAKWVVLINNILKEKKLDATIIAWVHDEVQIAVRKGEEENVGNIARRCAKEAGQTRIEFDEQTEKSLIDLYQVLKNAQLNGFTTKSKFSRTWANIIAMAASEGLISTRASLEIWGNRWHVTEDGEQFIEELEDVID